MNNFNLHTPTRILFGKGAIADLRAQIPADARVLITYGGGSVKKPAYWIRFTARWKVWSCVSSAVSSLTRLMKH